MDNSKETYNPNPRDGANPLSILFFTYTIGMFKKGYQKTLDVDDLYNPIRSDRSKLLGDRIEGKWLKHLEKAKIKNKSPSLLKVLVQTFWPEYLLLGVILVVMDLIVRLSQPLMLGKLLNYFRADSDISKTEALWYAGAIVGLNAASALLINQYIMLAFHYGMKVRAACCALIYRKALRLSKTALGDTASGKIVNLLSNDVSRFDMVSIFIHNMWVAPTSALIVMYFLYSEAGYAGIIGIIPVFLVVPLQSYTGKLSAIYRKQTAMKTDERVRLMDEIISGVQVIKMYAWEKPFAKLIKIARKAELRIVTKSSYVRGLFMTFNLFTTRVALFCTLLTMALTEQSITAAKVFVFMSYFNILSQTMSTMFVRGISEIAELFVAIRRLKEFMVNEEFVPIKRSLNNNDSKLNMNKIINIRGLTAKWNLSTTEIALKHIDLAVSERQLIGIIGPVGSGKSSMLQMLLGELEQIEGVIDINGSISYASQEPWVFAATIRQNILFGSEYEKKRYNEVVKACALQKDFLQFSDGDSTLVGDRGASLSGGQKARINLARAVYRKADIYLLDDPLSAVDIHVSKHLYDDCINGFLLNKTRILVTHQVFHLKDADHILILNNGEIENQGTFQDLQSSDNLYAKLLTSEPEITEEEKTKQIENIKNLRKMSTRSTKSSIVSAVSELSLPESLLKEELEETDDENEPVKNIQEASSKGKVHGSLFWKYLLAGGNIIFVLIVLLLYLLAQAAASGVDYFVSFWVNIEEFRNITLPLNDINVEVTRTPQWSTEFCLYVYGGLTGSLFLFALMRSMLFYKLAMNSSQKLHDSIFHNVINSTMRFFDTNPSGRILNRFSKDIGSIDELLPKAILDAGQILLLMVGSLVLVALVNPYFLILVGIVGVFFMLLRHVFLRSSKNIKRLEGIMRSPVFTHLNATLQGLTTIRAYGAQNVLRDEFDKHQDYHTSAWFMFISASSAFGFYLDVLCFIFVGIITFSFLTFGEEMGLSAGMVGLAITQAAALTGIVQWGMRQSAEVANQLMSVERVLEYETLPKEKQPEIPKTPSKIWPEKGLIQFNDLGLRYDEDTPLVLKSLNFEIKPNEKVGIVGRTGAGKSSLISALFRLAKVEGEITIDGLNTKDITLQDLRTRISIIPQDPVLFSGTLRYNLDPFEEYKDDQLYKAINEVELKDPANIINRLENRVMDRGSNYSVGQRQLICLARAIIRNNKILMLDEATANVDPQKWIKHLESIKNTNKSPSLLKVLIQTFWPEYLILGFVLVVSDLLIRLSRPMLLGQLLSYFRPGSDLTKEDALWYAGGIVGLTACGALLMNQYIMLAFHYGMKVRAACCALIYRKSLRLSKTALGDTASGKIVNLLSNDVSRFDMVSILIHSMWVSPLLSLIVMYFLYAEAGVAGIIGIIPVFLVLPLQSYTAKLSAIYRKQTAMKTDERVRLMDEIISGVQVIKMYAWEKPFAKLIRVARKAEIRIITKSSYVRGLFMTFNLFTTRVALFCTLLTMALTDQSITAEKVFVFMSYYNILSQTLCTMFVRGLSEVAELFVAIRRIQDFMNNEEFVPFPKTLNNYDSKLNIDNIINVKNATLKYSPSTTELALKHINMAVKERTLTGIIGPVGSGKSSILQMMLGELIKIEGTIDINGSVAYASQEPWVFAGTIRQNILFGGEFDKKRYYDVVKACALEQDFKQFADGDATLVGDRGASLSGGQKARINLARAVYRDADIYLLDDPLSAVDIHVSKHLYEECINGFLCDKTRILVTHQVFHLKNADNILILKNGEIENEGTFQDLQETDNVYAQLLTSEPEEEKSKLPPNYKNIRKLSLRNRKASIASAVSELSIIDSIMKEEDTDSEDEEEEVAVKAVQEESSKGKVKGSLFWRYLLSGGNVFYIIFVLSLFLFTQAAVSGVDFFVSYWVNIEEFRNISITVDNSTVEFKTVPQWSTEFCLKIYGILTAALFIIAFMRSMLFYKLAMKSSQKLHDTIFSNVINSTMRFFDTNSSGRILNRFSKDIGSIDELLPKTILDSGQILLMMAGSLILVAVVNPYFLILVVLIGVIFGFIRQVFLKSSKNIKRLEGIMRSPVFTHLNATIQGLTTIRAYGAQDVLRDEFDKHQDYHTSAWFMFISASSAFGFSLDAFCFIFVAVITFSFLTFGESMGLSGAEVGLAITQSTALTGLVQWGMRQSAEVINQLMSVERVLEYEVLPTEKQPKIPKTPPRNWPENGLIQFKNLGLRYDESTNLVLKNLNIEIKPNEKVGIVGRTGAGKSSLISALFRLAVVEGEIKIDGVDTKDITLENLRKKISIIPQDPVLFSGTLRYNLDPFEEYSDDVLYKAINDVELKDPANIINRLENKVMDRGSNYSVGQRQLICLARAIIRNNKILMLDEATANVDPQTDELIQKTIRSKFANCTVLTVAHRLNTIMDSDKVLVMDAGSMAEYDSPHILLQNPNSAFSKMVAETGTSMANQLTRVAKQTFQRQNSVPE